MVGGAPHPGASPGAWAAFHLAIKALSPVITGREQLRTRRPFYGREGGAVWDPAAPVRLWAPCSFNTRGSRDPGWAGLPRCLLSREGRQGWEEGRSQWRRGSARPGSRPPGEGAGGPPGPLGARGVSPPRRRLSRPLRPVWHPATWLPRARCPPDSPCESRPAPPALPARGGGAGPHGGLTGPSAWLGTGQS